MFDSVLVRRAGTTDQGLVRIWKRYRGAVSKLNAWTSADSPSVRGTDPSLSTYLSQVEADPMFQSLYGTRTWQFADVEIAKLLAFQPQVETGRYEVMPGAAALRSPQTLAEFCLPVRFAEPMTVTGEGDPSGKTIALTFSSARPTLLFSGFGAAPDGFKWSILGRPNHVVVTNYNGRFYLKNGYHRLVSLLRMGFDFAPAIVTDSATWSDTGGERPGFFPEALMVSARPPMLAHFLSPDLAYRTKIRPQMTVIRVSISEQRIPIP